MSIVDDFTDLNRRWKTLIGQRSQEKWAIWFEGGNTKCWCYISRGTAGICPCGAANGPDLFNSKAEASAVIAQHTTNLVQHIPRKYTK